MSIEQKADKLRQEYLVQDRDRLVFNDFQKALPRLRQTALYDIFRRMPKGRLMHAHI